MFARGSRDKHNQRHTPVTLVHYDGSSPSGNRASITHLKCEVLWTIQPTKQWLRPEGETQLGGVL
jgi:hypothetical protein